MIELARLPTSYGENPHHKAHFIAPATWTHRTEQRLAGDVFTIPWTPKLLGPRPRHSDRAVAHKPLTPSVGTSSHHAELSPFSPTDPFGIGGIGRLIQSRRVRRLVNRYQRVVIARDFDEDAIEIFRSKKHCGSAFSGLTD